METVRSVSLERIKFAHNQQGRCIKRAQPNGWLVGKLLVREKRIKNDYLKYGYFLLDKFMADFIIFPQF